MFVCMYTDVCSCMCACRKAVGQHLGSFFSCSPPYCFEAESLTNMLGDLSVFAFQLWDCRCVLQLPVFCTDAADLNSGVQVCNLPTEPSP